MSHLDRFGQQTIRNATKGVVVHLHLQLKSLYTKPVVSETLPHVCMVYADITTQRCCSCNCLRYSCLKCYTSEEEIASIDYLCLFLAVSLQYVCLILLQLTSVLSNHSQLIFLSFLMSSLCCYLCQVIFDTSVTFGGVCVCVLKDVRSGITMPLSEEEHNEKSSLKPVSM